MLFVLNVAIATLLHLIIYLSHCNLYFIMFKGFPIAVGMFRSFCCVVDKSQWAIIITIIIIDKILISLFRYLYVF